MRKPLYVRIRGQTVGPHNWDEARQLFRDHRLTPSTEVSHDGTTWFPAGRIWKELQTTAPLPEIAAPPLPPLKPITAPTLKSRRKPGDPPGPRPLAPPFVPPKARPMGSPSRLVLTTLLQLAILGAVAYNLYFFEYALNFLSLLQNVADRAVGFTEARDKVLKIQGEILILAVVGWGVTLAATSFYCAWVIRVGTDLHDRGVGGLRFSPVWCAAWEFIPLANLWKPYQVLSELWDASIARGRDSWRKDEASGFVVAYWSIISLSRGLALIEVVIGIGSEPTVDYFSLKISLMLVRIALAVVGYLLLMATTILIHRRMTAAQPAIDDEI